MSDNRRQLFAIKRRSNLSVIIRTRHSLLQVAYLLVIEILFTGPQFSMQVLDEKGGRSFLHSPSSYFLMYIGTVWTYLSGFLWSWQVRQVFSFFCSLSAKLRYWLPRISFAKNAYKVFSERVCEDVAAYIRGRESGLSRKGIQKWWRGHICEGVEVR